MRCNIRTSNIQKNVVSSPSWNHNGNVVYYSKRSKYPNKNGSKFFDIYEYHINDKKENRLTIDSRGFSPCFIPSDSSLAYLSTYDGGQNIYLIDLKSRKSQKWAWPPAFSLAIQNRYVRDFGSRLPSLPPTMVNNSGKKRCTPNLGLV